MGSGPLGRNGGRGSARQGDRRQSRSFVTVSQKEAEQGAHGGAHDGAAGGGSGGNNSGAAGDGTRDKGEREEKGGSKDY